jgi:hypothetical protein
VLHKRSRQVVITRTIAPGNGADVHGTTTLATGQWYRGAIVDDGTQ